MKEGSKFELHTKKIGVILNTASGSSKDESVPEMEAIFKECGLKPARVWSGDSETLPRAFAEVEKQNLDILVVLGGDGTIAGAAELCRGKSLVLIPLPGGTMNLLAKALYGDDSWQNILRHVLTNAMVKKISGGEVAGHRFFISAICGAPALWAETREALREKELGKALDSGKIALDQMFTQKITYEFDDMHKGETEALTVTCPLVSTTLADDRQILEAAIIDVKAAGDILALFTATAFGAWRDAKQVAIVRTKHVVISGEKDIPVILDGEPVDIGREAVIEFIPDGFDALVPLQ